LKEFGHGHPIDLALYPQAYEKRIEMTDVIRRQQKTARASCILPANYVNTRDTAKHESHQELASMIHGRFHLRITSVSRFVLDRKVIFWG
jgi:hypothetical protein